MNKQELDARFSDVSIASGRFSRKTRSREVSGMLLALLAGMLYSVCSVLTKELQYLHPGQVCLYSYIGIFFLSIPDTIKTGHSIILGRKRFVMMVFRSIFSCTYMFLNLLSLTYLPPSKATSIGSCVPIFVSIAACLTLKEPCGVFDTAIALVTLSGTILMAKLQNLTPASFNTAGIAAAVSSVVMNTCNLLMLRLVKKSSRAVIMFHLGWVAIIELLIIMACMGEYRWHSCGRDTWLVLLFWLLSYVAQSAKTAGIKRVCAGPFTTARTASEIVFSFVIQSLALNCPDVYSIFGVVMVIASLILIGFKTWWLTLDKASNSFRRLKWIIQL